MSGELNMISSYKKLPTLSLIPNSSRIFENAIAKLKPVCENRNPSIFKMDSHSNIGFVIWRGPCIGSKAESAIMFLHQK